MSSLHALAWFHDGHVNVALSCMCAYSVNAHVYIHVHLQYHPA